MSIKVHETTDYSKFKFVFGNREINQANLKRIKESVEKNGPLVFIMVVNNTFEIIDGQHRFIVWKELGLPVNYIVKNNYGLAQVHTFNQNTKNWGMNEFMNSYVKMKYNDYEIYKFFKNQYKFGHGETLSLLNGSNFSNNTRGFEDFRLGRFKVKDLPKATEIAERVYDFEPYYEGFKRRCFVFAIMKLSKLDGMYDHSQMINKISYQSAKLTDQSTVADYLRKLEEIYNYKSRTEHVRFDLAA